MEILARQFFTSLFFAFSVLAKWSFANLLNKSIPPCRNSLAASSSEGLPAPEGTFVPNSNEALSSSSRKLARLIIEAAATER